MKVGRTDNRADVERLKQLLIDGWNQILGEYPDERVYAFGIYTNECGESMFPFLLGESGLEQVANRYVVKGMYTAENAAKNLRWSTADSPYNSILGNRVYLFDGRPEIHKLSPTAASREVNYRLTAGCVALQELDQQRLFGTDTRREEITLYIEGGDVNREWMLKWAKKLNPSSVFRTFAKIGAVEDVVGTFSEFGTKKVYETKAYAQSADKMLVAAATQYQLFVFDTKHLRQLFAKATPNKESYTSLDGVAMSGDGNFIAVIPSGGGKHANELFLVSGEKGESVQTVYLPSRPMAVAVHPQGSWVAVTDQSGGLNIYDAKGTAIGSEIGHKGWPRGIAVTLDGTTLATADSKSLIIWNTADWSKRHTLSLYIDSVDFDSTGRFLAGTCRYAPIADVHRAVRIVDVATGLRQRNIVVDGFRIERARFSPDGRQLACAMRIDSEKYSGTNISALVDIETATVIDQLKADFEQVRDFAFLPHRNEIAVAVFGHTRRPLVLWKPKGF